MDHYAKSPSFTVAASALEFLLDHVDLALLMKEVEKKMVPHGMEYFLRDMSTVVEYDLEDEMSRNGKSIATKVL